MTVVSNNSGQQGESDTIILVETIKDDLSEAESELVKAITNYGPAVLSSSELVTELDSFSEEFQSVFEYAESKASVSTTKIKTAIENAEDDALTIKTDVENFNSDLASTGTTFMAIETVVIKMIDIVEEELKNGNEEIAEQVSQFGLALDKIQGAIAASATFLNTYGVLGGEEKYVFKKIFGNIFGSDCGFLGTALGSSFDLIDGTLDGSKLWVQALKGFLLEDIKAGIGQKAGASTWTQYLFKSLEEENKSIATNMATFVLTAGANLLISYLEDGKLEGSEVVESVAYAGFTTVSKIAGDALINALGESLLGITGAASTLVGGAVAAAAAALITYALKQVYKSIDYSIHYNADGVPISYSNIDTDMLSLLTSLDKSGVDYGVPTFLGSNESTLSIAINMSQTQGVTDNMIQIIEELGGVNTGIRNNRDLYNEDGTPTDRLYGMLAAFNATGPNDVAAAINGDPSNFFTGDESEEYVAAYMEVIRWKYDNPEFAEDYINHFASQLGVASGTLVR